MAGKDDNIIIKINADISEAKKQFQALEELGEHLDKGLQKIAISSAAGFASIAAGIGISVKAFADFESTFSTVVTTLDQGSRSLDQYKADIAELRQQVIDLGTDTGESFANLNAGLFDLISTNGDAKQSIKDLAIATDLAKAGATNTANAVKGLIAVQSAYGASAGTTQAVAEKLFVAQKVGITTVEQLATNFNKVAGLSKTLGFSFDETLSAASALTKDGAKPTAEAFSQLKSALDQLVQAQKKVFGPTEKVAKDLNLTEEATRKLQAALNNDRIKNVGFVQTFRDINQILGGNTVAMQTVFSSTEALQAVFAVTGAQAETFNGLMKSLADEQGRGASYAAALTAKQETLETAFAKLQRSSEAALITIGQQFAPMIAEAANQLAALIKSFTSLDEPTKNAITNITLFVAGALGITAAVATFGTGVASLIGMIANVGRAFTLLGSSAAAAWAAATVGISVLIAFLPQIIDFGNQIISNSDQIADHLRKNYGGLGEAGATLIELFTDLLGSVIELLEPFRELGKELQTSGQKAQDFANGVKVLAATVQSVFSVFKIAGLTLILAVTETAKQFLGILATMQDAYNALRKLLGLAPVENGVREYYNTLKAFNAELISDINRTTDALAKRNAQLYADISTSQPQAVHQPGENGPNFGNAGPQPDETTPPPGTDNPPPGGNPLQYHGNGGAAGGKKSFADRLKELKEQWLTEEQATQEHQLELLRIETEAHNKFLLEKKRYGEAYAQISRVINSKELAATGEFFGQLASLQNSSIKELRAIGKAGAIAEVIFKTPKAAFDAYTGMIAAFPGPAGMALGAAAAATVVAKGVSTLADIRKGDSKGALQGGIVTGGEMGKDSVSMMLSKGELVIPEPLVKPLMPSLVQVVDQARNNMGDQDGGRQGLDVRLIAEGDLAKFVRAEIVRSTVLGIDPRK